MAKSLDVYLEDKFVGNLIQNNHGQMLFSYAEIWLENPNAIPLSQSLPLRKDLFSTKECRGFFAGILPEQSIRKTVSLVGLASVLLASS